MDMVQQITQMVGKGVQGAYQSRFTLISTAAALANTPNWQAVLQEEFDRFVADMKEQEKENKDQIANQVPAEKLIEARGAITDAVDEAIKASQEHYDDLVAMIGRLTTSEYE